MTARILIFTGDGSGKTSAALGKVLRLVARGRSVVVLQFLKHDPDTGEIASLSRLGVKVEQSGRGFVICPEAPTHVNHREAAQAGVMRARELLTNHDAVVLDEICGAVALGLIDESQVIDLFTHLQSHQVCICTGRSATPGLIAAADTVSELACVKHAYQQHIPAMVGIER